MAWDGETPVRPVRPIGGLSYLAAVMPLLALEYAAAFYPGLTTHSLHGSWIGKIGWMSWLGRVEGSLLGLLILACCSAIGWLGLRRATATGKSGTAVAISVVPWLQLPAILWLALSRSASSRPASTAGVRGALWGLAIAFGAELILTLAFGDYGIALFVGTPFVVGFVAAFLAQRDGHSHPIAVAQGALLLASTVLFGFAFEGLFCLLLAYPLAAVATVIGGAFGL